MATVAIAAVVVAGCGSSDFKDQARAPVPLQLTGVIQKDRVTVSPSRKLGAGPFEITIANQTTQAHSITLEGGEVEDHVGSVQPSDTIVVRKTLSPGTYQVKAGTAEAVAKEIQPATLRIGKERPDSNSDLQLP